MDVIVTCAGHSTQPIDWIKEALSDFNVEVRNVNYIWRYEGLSDPLCVVHFHSLEELAKAIDTLGQVELCARRDIRDYSRVLEITLP